MSDDSRMDYRVKESDAIRRARSSSSSQAGRASADRRDEFRRTDTRSNDSMRTSSSRQTDRTQGDRSRGSDSARGTSGAFREERPSRSMGATSGGRDMASSGNYPRSGSRTSQNGRAPLTPEQRARRKMKRRELLLKKRRRNVIIVMVEMVLCLILCIATYGVKLISSYAYEDLDPSVYVEPTTARKSVTKTTEVRTSIVEHTNESGEVIATEQVTLPPDEENVSGYQNILVLGLDARSQYSYDAEGLNSDVMIVVSINNDTGDIKMVSIMRDTIMKMENSPHAYDKANNQYAVSGISDTVSMINRNLGLDITDYVVVNWYGVAVCINQMGGVTLTIPNNNILYYFNSYLTFVNEATGIWAPQLSEPGTYLMTGTQAVAFCRIRYGGYEDQGRSANQREVISQLFQKAKDMLRGGDIGTLISVAQTALGNVKTNLSMPEIIRMIAELETYNMAGSYSFPVNYVGGKYVGNYPAKYNIVDPMVASDFAGEVKQLHYFLFNDADYVPSDFVYNISEQMRKDMNGE